MMLLLARHGWKTLLLSLHHGWRVPGNQISPTRMIMMYSITMHSQIQFLEVFYNWLVHHICLELLPGSCTAGISFSISFLNLPCSQIIWKLLYSKFTLYNLITYQLFKIFIALGLEITWYLFLCISSPLVRINALVYATCFADAARWVDYS